MSAHLKGPETDPTRLFRYRDGLYAVDLLTVAVTELDFFTWLADRSPCRTSDILAHYEFAERPVDVLLTLCAANALIERAGDMVTITEVAQEHLTAGSRWNLGPYYASLKDRPVARDFLEVLRTDRPAGWGGGKDQSDWHVAMETDAFSRAFTAAMDARGQYLAQAFAGRLDLGGRRRVLDIGGGSGVYSCALCARRPEVTSTIFEKAPVDAIATATVADRGYAERISVLSGDMFEDEFPSGFSVHLFSNVLHDWGTLEVRRLLARSRRAIEPGGLLVIHEAFINADKTGPLPVAEYSALLMHSTQGKCYATSEYDTLLDEAGFKPGPYVDTVADRGFMTATAT